MNLELRVNGESVVRLAEDVAAQAIARLAGRGPDEPAAPGEAGAGELLPAS